MIPVNRGLGNLDPKSSSNKLNKWFKEDILTLSKIVSKIEIVKNIYKQKYKEKFKSKKIFSRTFKNITRNINWKTNSKIKNVYIPNNL